MIRPQWSRHASALLFNCGGSPRSALAPQDHPVLCPLAQGGISTRHISDGRRDGEHGLPARGQLSPAREDFLEDHQQKRDLEHVIQPYGSSQSARRDPRSQRSPSLPLNKDIAQQGRISVADADRQSGRPPLHQSWPLLKKRHRRLETIKSVPSNGNMEPSDKKDARLMLTIDGLSPNLSATDFYRLAPSELSGWKDAIKTVQQQRHATTLEPLGRYLVTFNTVEAATAYRDRLNSLHKVTGHKLSSASGLWESTVPVKWKSILSPIPKGPPDGESSGGGGEIVASSPTTAADDLASLLTTFTLAPGSQASIPVQRTRVLVRHAWAKRLAEMVEPLGFGDKPPVVLLDIYPSTLTADEVFKFIRRDGAIRGLRWQVSAPFHLKDNQAVTFPKKPKAWDEEDDIEASKPEDAPEAKHMRHSHPSFRFNDHDTWEKLKGRFVIACADEAEARRFQRSWNNRVMTTSRSREQKYVVHSSVINW